MLSQRDRETLEKSTRGDRKIWWCRLNRREMPEPLQYDANTKARRIALLWWIMRHEDCADLVEFWRAGQWYDVTLHLE